jgi:dGTPase
MDRALNRLRFAVEESRGRRYPELVHPYRNAFQRDRDRIVHARAFRRLEDKTQVFTAGISDHFRNRLTHTIEVAQIARTVAGVLGLDEDLTEALALAHDIGHPPFAHSGELELDRRMTHFGERFDHNLHALRIVESFEQPYASFPGLNLTFEVREGIVKHSRDLRPGESGELEEYRPAERPPLEAQLIDLADEIAYSTADLDDAYSAQFFDLETLGREVPPYAAIRETVETQFPGATVQTRFRETLRRVIDALVTGLIEGTWEAAGASGAGSAAEVRRQPARLARFTPASQSVAALLKGFLHRHVYDSAVLAEERRRVSAMMGDLFDLLMAEPWRLPSPYREQAAEEPVHRIVCDYIAGMTDGFFRRTHQQMLG